MALQDSDFKYELAREPITVSGKTLEFYRVADLEPVLEDVLERSGGVAGHFPLWVKVWEASIVLADHLCRNEPADPPLNVLEIGAGMGVAGMFMAAMGHRVTLTDSEPDAVCLAQYNARKNGLEGVSVRQLDWNAPMPMGRFDLVIGSELIYDEKAPAPVLSLVKEYLAPGGKAVFAHDIGRHHLKAFSELAARSFSVSLMKKTLRSADETQTLLFHFLTR